MPKVKVPRKSTHIDMTAMCDVAFLLLTFFMLTTQFKDDEPFVVSIPKSVSEKKLPDVDIMTITVQQDRSIFFGIANGKAYEGGPTYREMVLDRISEVYGLQFTTEEKKQFSLVSSFGVPIDSLKFYLASLVTGKKDFKQNGIPVPIDSTSKVTNELIRWVGYGFEANTKFKIAIKADGKVPYPAFRAVTNTLQDPSIDKYQYYLITSLEARPIF